MVPHACPVLEEAAFAIASMGVSLRWCVPRGACHAASQTLIAARPFGVFEGTGIIGVSVRSEVILEETKASIRRKTALEDCESTCA